MNKLKQAGFSAVEILIVIVLIGIVAFVGWKVYDSGGSEDQTPSTSQQQQDDTPEVNSASDLKEAEDYLNDQDIDKTLDTSDIDNALAE